MQDAVTVAMKSFVWKCVAHQRFVSTKRTATNGRGWDATGGAVTFFNIAVQAALYSTAFHMRDSMDSTAIRTRWPTHSNRHTNHAHTSQQTALHTSAEQSPTHPSLYIQQSAGNFLALLSVAGLCGSNEHAACVGQACCIHARLHSAITYRSG